MCEYSWNEGCTEKETHDLYRSVGGFRIRPFKVAFCDYKQAFL